MKARKRGWKTQAIRAMTYDFLNFVGTKTAMRELCRRPCGLDVAGVQPDFVAFLEQWGGGSTAVVIPRVVMCEKGRGSDWGEVPLIATLSNQELRPSYRNSGRKGGERRSWKWQEAA